MKKSDAFPSNFLRADDLKNAEGKPVAKRVTITAIEDVAYDDGKKQRLISFAETKKKLGLNVTNWNACCTISGQDPKDSEADDDKFVGMKIELFRTMVDFKGEMVPSVRIRPVGGWENWTGPTGDDHEESSKVDDSGIPF